MASLTSQIASGSSPQAPSALRAPHGAASKHLDALRGIAAVGVCWSHLRDLFFRDYNQVPGHHAWMQVLYLATGLGHQWVVIFFVLSGYLVGGSVLRAFATNRWSWGTYLLNRLTRLYAVLIPALLLGALLDVSGCHLFGLSGVYGGATGAHELSVRIPDRLTWPIFLGNLAYLQGIFVMPFGSNGPMWSLANEFWYYIAFPFLGCALWPKLSVGKRILNFALFAAVIVFIKPAIALMGLLWLMGVLIHFVPDLPSASPLLRRALIAAAALACCATLAWCKQSRSGFADYILGVVVTALIYAILVGARTPMPRIYNATAHFVSRSSYTLYLTHVPMLLFLGGWIAQPRWNPTPVHLAQGLGIFVVLMLYAQVVWFCFESRTDAIRNWFRPKTNR